MMVTLSVIGMVQRWFPEHVGVAADFALPVTGAQAREALDDFVANRLADFGTFQDAMKAGEPVLFHALVSTSLNLGLLEPREICVAAEAAYRAGGAKLNAVEGFIRQILGWREFVRGVYWANMPDYAGKNMLGAGAAPAVVLLDGQDADELPAPCDHRHDRQCLRAPYPAADDHRQFRAAGRAASR